MQYKDLTKEHYDLSTEELRREALFKELTKGGNYLKKDNAFDNDEIEHFFIEIQNFMKDATTLIFEDKEYYKLKDLSDPDYCHDYEDYENDEEKIIIPKKFDDICKKNNLQIKDCYIQYGTFVLLGKDDYKPYEIDYTMVCDKKTRKEYYQFDKIQENDLCFTDLEDFSYIDNDKLDDISLKLIDKYICDKEDDKEI